MAFQRRIALPTSHIWLATLRHNPALKAKRRCTPLMLLIIFQNLNVAENIQPLSTPDFQYPPQMETVKQYVL